MLLGRFVSVGAGATAVHYLVLTLLVWGGGHIGAGERVASDGWRPDAARVSGIGASNVQPNRNGMDCEIPARF